MIEYPKIYGPFDRHTEGPDRNKLIIGQWSRPEFELLKDLSWVWTEKIDGTNIRVHWDGHRVVFGGRTANAQIPAKLVAVLISLFPEELFEQQFGDTAVTLFGEGYGAGIQKGGGNYRPTGVGFTLFDVRIGEFWLYRHDVGEIASKLGIEFVPQVAVCGVLQAVEIVRNQFTSVYGNFIAEGLVGTAPLGLLDRAGRRIMMKVKAVDFRA
jgi:hypothetical protein